MTQAISEFFSNTFGNNVLLATFLIAIIPLIELKGAIPFGMSSAFWGEHALSAWSALFISFLGSFIVVPLIALIFKPIVVRLNKYRFFHAIINFFTEDLRIKSKSINEKEAQRPNRTSIFMKMLTVAIFVAFPVPLTGVWAGTCFAVLLGLNLWQTCLSTLVGNFVCGLIVTFICSIFPDSTYIILYIFICLLVVTLTAKIIIHFVKQKLNKTISKQGEENKPSFSDKQ